MSKLHEFFKILWNKLKNIWAIFLVAPVYYIFGCPIHRITGISCPGCGMTRACWCAAKLDFHDAFKYHPLFVLIPFMVVLWVLGDFINNKLRNILWGIVIFLFISVYIIRIALNDPFIEINPGNSCIVKFIKLIKGEIND